MIDDDFEQLHDDNQDYDEVETIEKMAARRALASEESERDGRQLGMLGEIDHHGSGRIGSHEESDLCVPRQGAPWIASDRVIPGR
jgi:hypothetical protein